MILRPSLIYSRGMNFKYLLVGEYLRENLTSPPTQEDICEHFDLTEYKLRQGFKRTHGTTMGRYLRKKRMQKAARLLSTSNDGISQIAKGVGFRNSSRFAEAFKTEYGVNPFEFRKACRQGSIH